MGMKEKIIKKQLKRLGYDMSNPKEVTKKTIVDLVNVSVPSVLSKEEMITFLQNLIEKIEKEWGV